MYSVEKPFKSLNQAVSVVSLESRIHTRIRVLERRARIKHLVLSTASALVSVVAFAVSSYYAFNTLVSSGFGDYAGLLFTGGTTMLAYSKELLLSMLESLPALGLSLVLAFGFASVWTISRAARDSRVLLARAA